MIVVIDFGSQTTHLIARRIKEFGVATVILAPENALDEIEKLKPQGIILSGGPSSVYENGAPTIDLRILSLGIPILGICYGLQLAMQMLGGKVISGKKEYGPATLQITRRESRIAQGLPNTFGVWMNHGDEVISLPKDFSVIGSTEHVPFAFTVNEKKKIYGLLFHPEVEHTEHGKEILRNFIKICNISESKYEIDEKAMEKHIKETVGNAYVIGAISGGVDSTVAGVLTARAIGKQFIPIFVDNGLMREGTIKHVKEIFTDFGIIPDIVLCEDEMLERLKNITDPEEKRKIIGKFYIEVFEREMEKLKKQRKDVQFLMQGTIYSDVIESQGTKHAAKIKSHHNVGGLPKNMQLKLLEPLRELYKDEVRALGKKLGLSETFVQRQPFPGPGYAVRIRGEVTKERLFKAKHADTIVLEELEKAKILPHVFLSFPVMTGTASTAIKGDGKFFGEVIALRVVQSTDVMTAKWVHLPYDVLQKIASRIVNEVPDISRVVYDISTKPPATMEWE